MSDALRSHEIANALLENERAMRAVQMSCHSLFMRLDALERKQGAVEAQLAQQRVAIETLVAVHQTLVDLRRDELALERDKVEREITGEVARVEAEAKARVAFVDALRDGARGSAAFLQTRTGWGVLFLCGMIVAWAMGTDQFSDLASNMLALLKGWRAP
jgi:hypothetical protein